MPLTFRNRDDDVLRACLRRLRRDVDLPVFFGGMTSNGAAVLTELVGTRTEGIRGLNVLPGRGLGGRAYVDEKPRAVLDYRTDRTITHDYDRPVLAEGITSLLALPVRAFGKARGLVYLGTRDSSRVGDRLAAAARPALNELESEIRIRDEVDRRVGLLSAGVHDSQELTSLREVQAELRTIAAAVEDPLLEQRLRAVGDLLVPAAPSERVLSRRELDVLSLVALGCGNAEIATRLCIGVETVRSYVRNAMSKVGAHTRLEAVVRARRLGELL